ncbi:MAG: hypothetical protein ACYS0C_05090 [Planctomycetota bacterium]|jgi:hypothetical protein
MKKLITICTIFTVMVMVAPVANAMVTIDFEDLGLAPGQSLHPADDVPIISRGFSFTPTSNTQFSDVHAGNALSNYPYNGTTVMVTHDETVMMEATNGTSFTLFSFDFAGYPTDNEVPFSLQASNGTVANYTPDGLVDGPGGDPDFQTFTLPAGFTNITSVLFIHTGQGTTQGLFGLDNLNANVIPAPGAILLSSIGVSLVGWLRRRRTL